MTAIYQELYETFTNEIATDIPANDGPMMAEAWNNYTDSELSGLLYHHCPAYDEEMPDDAFTYVLEQMGFTLAMTRVEQRADGLCASWDANARHWSFTIKRAGAELAGHYSQGAALVNAPELADVFASLCVDADTFDSNPCLAEFVIEHGYTNAKQARTAWAACKAASEWLASAVPNKSERLELQELASER